MTSISKLLAPALVAVALLAPAQPALAHHSFGAEFDDTRIATAEGVVTRIWWRNPHIRYEIAVTKADGALETWEIEGGATTGLINSGWTRDSIQVGDHIRVTGAPSRENLPKIYLRRIELDDGSVLPKPRDGAADAPAYTPSAPFHEGTANRPVDITGTWSNSYKFHLTVDDLEPKPYPFTDEARAIYESREFGDDPALRCVPIGGPRLFGAPRNMQILDAGDFYLFVYEAGSQHRWVYMDGRQPAENEPLSYNGFSVGHWEGRELVIETDHLLPGWLDGSGLPMSGPGTRLVERWTFADDGATADRVMTITDPLYTAPLTRVRGSARSAVELHEESCDPDSFFQDLERQDLLSGYFERDRL